MLNYKFIVTVTNQNVHLISLSRHHECNLSERHLWICGADSSDHFIILLHHFWKVRVEVIQTLTSFEKLKTWVKRLFNPAARNQADQTRASPSMGCPIIGSGWRGHLARLNGRSKLHKHLMVSLWRKWIYVVLSLTFSKQYKCFLWLWLKIEPQMKFWMVLSSTAHNWSS